MCFFWLAKLVYSLLKRYFIISVNQKGLYRPIVKIKPTTKFTNDKMKKVHQIKS